MKEGMEVSKIVEVLNEEENTFFLFRACWKQTFLNAVQNAEKHFMHQSKFRERKCKLKSKVECARFEILICKIHKSNSHLKK